MTNNYREKDWEKEFDEHKAAWMNKGIPSPCALYLHICQWCGPYLPFVLKTSLGGQPGQLITKIKNSVEIARNYFLISCQPQTLFTFLPSLNP